MLPTQKIHSSTIDLDLSEGTHTTDNALWGSAGVQLTLQTDKPGKHHGHLCIPLPPIDNTLAQHRVPVCMIKGQQEGPTVTFIAGIHGDEHEGTLTLNRLARELNAESLHGTVFLLPAINTKGLQTNQRHNPLDNYNLDYAFPGNATGGASERLAYEITQHFISPAQLIVDLRSGGHNLQFIPSAAVRFETDKALSALNEQCMIAFGAPNSLRLPKSASSHCLQSTVNGMGKQYVQTELGNGAINSVLSLSIAYTGCMNILRHMGLLKQEIELASTRLLEVRDNSYYVHATKDALFEPKVYPAENVWQQEPLGLLVPLTNTAANCEPVFATRDACLLATHPGGYVHEGQLLAILAEPVQA